MKFTALRKSFSRLRVLVVGDLLADHYLRGRTERVSREAPVLVLRHESDEIRLGGAANVAANARSLGAQVTALGVLGVDEAGRGVAALLKKANIRSQAISSTGLRTETRTRILGGAVGTSLQQMLRIDSGNGATLAPAIERELAERLAKLGAASDVVIVSDYGAGALNSATRDALWQLAPKTLVCVDSRSNLGAFHGVAVCKPNEPELAQLTGMPAHGDKELKLAGAAARERLGCRHLLVTRGQAGMALFTVGKGEPLLLAAHGAHEAVDVTGAGDTVLAAFSTALAAGASPEEAARVANIAASIVVQREGTATVSWPDLEASSAT